MSTASSEVVRRPLIDEGPAELPEGLELAQDPGYYRHVFGPDGYFARQVGAAYEVRPGQITTALAVDRAIQNNRHVVVEAATGIGKSYAYLVPALRAIALHREDEEDKEEEGGEGGGRAANRYRVVVSTGNTALQAQLFMKDLPALAATVPIPFTYQRLMGRSRYLCLEAVDRLQAGLLTDLNERGEEVARLLKWAAEKTTTGLQQESPVTDMLWSKVSVGGEECTKQNCDHHQTDCWYTLAARSARQADIIVTNHALLFLHLQLFGITGSHHILPKFDCLIVDEAHEMASYARSVWGATLRKGSTKRAVERWRHIAHPWRTAPIASKEHEAYQVCEELLGESDMTFDRVDDVYRPDAPAISLAQTGLDGYLRSLRAMLARACATFEAIFPSRLPEPYQGEAVDVVDPYEGEKTDPNDHERKDFLASRQRVLNLVGIIDELMLPPDANHVIVVSEQRGRSGPRHELQRQPVSVAELLRQKLFEVVPSSALVSATLATDAGHDHRAMRNFIDEHGVIDYEQDSLVVGSPFNLREQLGIYLPKMPAHDAPDGPNGTRGVQWTAAVIEQIARIIEQVRGRTLVLFTSYRMLNQAHEALVDRIPYRVYRQGELPTSQLIEAFRNDVDSCLFGTKSMWTGIDIPGESLSCVVIDKLPFASKNEPILSAKAAVLERAGRSSYKAWQDAFVPPAIIEIRQAIGRSIRRNTDRAVVAILDQRVTTKSYGRQFRTYLDVGRYLYVPDDIGRFLYGGASR